MADKKISDLTEATSVAGNDWFVIENAGGNSRKVSGANAKAFSGARVYKSANQTAADYTTLTNVAFDSEHFDTDGYHDTGSNTERLTVAVAGYYEVSFSLAISSLTADMWALAQTRRFNSSSVEQASNAGTARMTTEIGSNPRLTGNTGPVLCSAGDYFTVALQVETDNSITVEAAGTTFAIQRVG